jgi:hypothetical protein
MTAAAVFAVLWSLGRAGRPQGGPLKSTAAAPEQRA